MASKCRDEEVTVVRGKCGAMQRIDIWKLVVGDVVILDAGDKVPADCIIIESTNLDVQYKDLIVRKDATKDPFLFADSYIYKGTARVVVAVVG